MEMCPVGGDWRGRSVCSREREKTIREAMDKEVNLVKGQKEERKAGTLQ